MRRPCLLVTGGSGFLGSWVVELAREEWDVAATYLTRQVEEAGVDWRELNIEDQAAVSALIEDLRPSAVIHSAALNPGQGRSFKAVNTRGTQNVARAAALFGARLVHVSTDVLFDGNKGSSWRGKREHSAYVEEDRPSPITPYGRSKALAEDAVRKSDAQAVIVRTSLIYGPCARHRDEPIHDVGWQRWDRQTRWVIGDLKVGRPLRLFVDDWRCPVWVESLAAALLELVRLRDTRGLPFKTLHVAGAQSLSRYQFGTRLAHFHGIEPDGIIPALSRNSGLTRPLDCTLDCSRARTLLRTPLPGVEQVLQPSRATTGLQS